ncbi:MAG: polysaccharide pyruvyl transferase family protein [Galbibacter orientalis]|uniref:polysaccharide pyruvyl transferase family protein n=1 Tax=Galbibacter orientalis TaxID=453852 RepID=UPI003002A78E
MKIALITIHNVTNYGAILQAYATNEVLSSYGEVTVINYQKKHLSSHMDLVRFEMSIRGLKWVIHDTLNIFARYKMISRFKSFIKATLSLSKLIEDNDNFNDVTFNYDVFVSGSDQIWNPSIVSESKSIDPVYFLSFAPLGSKKISYASSIGHHSFTKIEKIEVMKLLKDFSHISVREKDGRQKLAEILPEREIEVVLDPTLLLSKNDWLHKLKLNNLEVPKEKYILVYSVPRTELIRKAVDYFSKKLNYKVISIDKMLMPLTKVDNHVNNAGPREFIQLYANASFVISDSFHGLCYAINFEKPFVAVSSNKVGNRQENLLALLQIKEKDVLVRSEDDFKNISSEMDFTNVRKKLQHYREKSMDYLKIAIRKSDEG